MNEIWVDIKGFEGYQVSNFGRVKSLERKDSIGRRINYKILKPNHCSTNGYELISLRKNGKTHKLSIHRLVAINFIPNPNNKEEVNHKNGVKTDNRVLNLEWSTRSENIKHASENGLLKNGEDHSFSKLTNNQVLEIRKLRKENPQKYTQERLGTLFNVTQSHIGSIVNYKKRKVNL